MAQPIYDGQASFEGGQDSSLPPSRLPENKIASGVNISTVQGVLGPRFGFDRKTLKFPKGGYSYTFNKVTEFKTIFETGKFQAMSPYRIGNKYYVVVVISGVIFLINQETYEVSVLTLNKETQLNESAPRHQCEPAGRFLVISDFPDLPVILEGQTAFRSDRYYYQLPPFKHGVYNQSRFFFSNAGNEFSAGDPVGSPLTPDAPITVEEIEAEGSLYLGDVYQAPTKFNSPITAMATLQSVDTSTGIGALIVASKKELFAFNTTSGRDQWLAGQFGTSISAEAGIVGSRAHVNVNSDLFFVSSDGMLRSLSAASEEQRKWARVPMSVEVKNWVSYISSDLIEYTCLGYFKNKIFWTVRPFRIPAKRLNGNPILDVAHSGLLVLELDNVARVGQDAPPAWAGLWTGIRPLDMCTTDERMFVLSKDGYSRNTLYEVDPELTYDKAGSQRRQIKSIIYTREHIFQDLFALKSLRTTELGLSNLSGDIKVKVEWKPSHSSKFLFWGDFNHTIPVEQRDILNGEIHQRLPLAFREIKLGLYETLEGHPVTRDLYDTVKRVQLKITIQADSWKLNEYRIEASAVKDNNPEFLPDDMPEVTQIAEPNNDWSYEEFGL